MDRLEAMSLLLDTLDAGSFSAAARRRGMPVATLVRKIDKLERHLSAALLIRSTRGLSLTQAGQRYVEASRGIIARVEEIEREAAGELAEPTGRLVVSAPRMFGRLHVLPIVNDFLRLYPGISVELMLVDSNVDLAGGAADMAVRIGALPDSSLIATRVGSMRSVTAASPDLLDRYPAIREPGDLAKLPGILLDIPMPPTVSRRYGGPTHGESHQARLVVSSAEAAVDAAEAGIGVVHLLYYQVAGSIGSGRLQLLLEEFEPEAAPVHFLHAPLPQLPLKVRYFLDFAKDRMRAKLLEIQAGRSQG